MIRSVSPSRGCKRVAMRCVSIGYRYPGWSIVDGRGRWRVAGRCGEQLAGVHRVQAIGAVAELAGDLDRALLGDDGVDLGLAQGAQHVLDAGARAAAAEGEGLGVEEPHRLLVEEPVQQVPAGSSRSSPGFTVAASRPTRAQSSSSRHRRAGAAAGARRRAASSAASQSRVGSCSEALEIALRGPPRCRPDRGTMP